MSKACFVILALAGLTALAQTPPASKAPKARGPVFIDFGALAQPAPASNAAPAAIRGQPEPGPVPINDSRRAPMRRHPPLPA